MPPCPLSLIPLLLLAVPGAPGTQAVGLALGEAGHWAPTGEKSGPAGNLMGAMAEFMVGYFMDGWIRIIYDISASVARTELGE